MTKKCDIPIETLNAYLDGELDEQEQKRLDTHIATCAHCQQELDALQALDTRIRESKIQGPSREFIFRVNRNVMDNVRRKRRFTIFRLTPFIVPVAVAALILIVAVNMPQPERLISLDDQVRYKENDLSSVSEAKKVDLQLPVLPSSVDGVPPREASGGYAAKKEAAPLEKPSAPVVSKSGERMATAQEEYFADDRDEGTAAKALLTESEIPRNQVVRAIVDTSGNIVKVATGNTIVPETDTVLEKSLKGRQVQVPMVGGRRTQLYIDFTRETEDTQTP